MNKTQRFEALRKFSCVECGRRPVDIAHSNFSERGKGNGISATIASTKQFTEYLNDIYAFSYAKGVLLEIPQDLAWCRG